MSAALQQTDFANLQGIYHYLDIPPLSYQEEHFVLLCFRGLSVAAAERGAGMCRGRGKKTLEKEATKVLLEYLREQRFNDTRVTLETLNTMAFEAHMKATTATEELAAVATLGKLNMIGGFAPNAVVQARLEEARETNRGKDIMPTSTKQLERMDEGDLLFMADLDGLDSLDPVEIDHGQKDDDDTIEAEYEQTDKA